MSGFVLSYFFYFGNKKIKAIKGENMLEKFIFSYKEWIWFMFFMV